MMVLIRKIKIDTIKDIEDLKSTIHQKKKN